MRKRQGLLIILDGLGDRPNPQLEGLTPLEAARTPSLDRLVQNGMCGNVYPIAPGVPVGTDVGHLHIFGCDSRKTYRGRGPLEAMSAGLELLDGDVAFRGNFATITPDKTVIDRRAGRIHENTAALAASLNGMELAGGITVLAKELTEHRVAIVFRGENLSDAITCTDPGTGDEGKPMAVPAAQNGGDEAALRTARALQEFTNRACALLNDHPVNQKRRAAGKLPANVVLTRGAGQKIEIPSLQSRLKLRAACIAGDQTVGGIATLVGMDYYTQESFTGSFDTDYAGKAKLALHLLNEKKYDWVVLHIKGTDLAGHDNLPHKKKSIIEAVDGMVGQLLDGIDLNNTYISFTADHSTPCEALDHTGDGVPTCISGPDVRRDSVRGTGEGPFMKGALTNLTAGDIFTLQMDLMGFTKKVGS